MKTTSIVLLAVLLTGLAHVASAADNLSAALQKGLLEEEANHNLDAAIQAYQSVINQYDDQRKIAATAVFRLGECYRKQGKTNEAVTAYSRVLRDFADQSALATLSRQNVTALDASTKASGSFSDRYQEIGVAIQLDEETKAIQQYKALAENSPDLLNARDNSGLTPLHHAASQGQLPVAKFLLTHGADANSRDSRGLTPLHHAALQDQKPMIELLLAQHADVNAKSPGGVTPLHYTAFKGLLSVTETLLANGADPNAETSGTTIEPFQPVDQFGNQTPTYFEATPLHYAAARGHLALVKLLLDHKADVNAKTKDGQTPLYLAVENDRLEVAKLLLANQGAPNVIKAHDMTLFGVAVKNQNLEMVQLLLAAGADSNALGVPFGYSRSSPGTGVDLFFSPLEFAAREGKTELAELLLKNKAKVNFQDDAGNTPLNWASQNGHTKMVKLLLENGGDPNLKNEDGDTPLHVSRSKEISELLLAKKADVKARNKSGRTPLHHAASTQGRKELVELLLSKGAEVNAADNLGQTPLFRAVFVQDKQNTELLIAHGADVNAKDNESKTPLELLTKPATAPVYGISPTQTIIPGLIPGSSVGTIPSRNLRTLPGVLPLGATGRPEVAQQTATADEIAGLLRKHGAKE